MRLSDRLNYRQGKQVDEAGFKTSGVLVKPKYPHSVFFYRVIDFAIVN